VNKKFARVEQIKRFHLLETQLSAEDEELTPTDEVEAQARACKYAPQIEPCTYERDQTRRHHEIIAITLAATALAASAALAQQQA